MGYVLSFIVALVLSLVLTPVMRCIALRLNLVHYPRPASIATHVKPIPYLGGLAIYLGCLAGIAVSIPIQGTLMRIVLGIMIMVIGGLIDDFLRISTSVKLSIQFLAAGVIVVSRAGQGLAVPLSFIRPLYLNQVITLLWLVGMTNAMNFLDIMDGLAAGVAAIAAGAFFLMAVMGGESSMALFCVALAGGALGFLVYNFDPAKIFMGDAGSQLLGLSLAWVALLVPPAKVMGETGIFVPLIVLGVPLFEITFTVAVRSLARWPAWKGSKDHYPLRLFALGYSVREIITSTYAAALGLAALGILLSRSNSLWVIVAVIVVLAAATWIGFFLSRVMVPRPTVSVSRRLGYTRTPKAAKSQSTKQEKRKE